MATEVGTKQQLLRRTATVNAGGADENHETSNKVIHQRDWEIGNLRTAWQASETMFLRGTASILQKSIRQCVGHEGKVIFESSKISSVS
jgi:hypothetical protein